MAFILILFPLVLAGIAALIPSNRLRPWVLPLAGLAHLTLTIVVLLRPDMQTTNAWLVLDPAGKIVLLLVSTLYLFSAFYSVGYLQYRAERQNRVFVACMLIFLGVVGLVTWAHHLGLMWVAIEATTLSTAPLIYFNHSKLSIEATWKYLLVGSVGIALALFGTYFLAYSAMAAGLAPSLQYEDLLVMAPGLSKTWLHAAVILLLVGYGTKMGLAPMHTWKPDAYGEAPGVVGAMLAGGVTSLAFLAFLRVYHITTTAGDAAFIQRILVFMGLLSMAVAGLFMVGQRDFKRMLAYSSVEHMGILMIGLGIGLPALFGTMLHIMTNGLTKGVLFLSAANIHRSYNSKNIDVVQGALRRLPVSAGLFLAGFIAITGSPPFGPFVSEFSILNGAFAAGSYLAAGLFLFFLLVVFIGMGQTVLKVVQGRAAADLPPTTYRDAWNTTAPIVALLALVLMLGVFIPEPVRGLLDDAVRFLGSKP